MTVLLLRLAEDPGMWEAHARSLFGGQGSNSAPRSVTRTLWAREARTGRQVWERAFAPLPPVIIAVTGDTVLAATSDKIRALSATAGSERWNHAMPVHPMIITTAGDVVYVAGANDPIAGNGPTEVCAFQA